MLLSPSQLLVHSARAVRRGAEPGTQSMDEPQGGQRPARGIHGRRHERPDGDGVQDDQPTEDPGASARASGALGARGILDAARELVEALGWSSEGLTGLRRGTETWTVTVDVVETRRVPSTTDLIAIYELELDGDGELVGYQRQRHYVRGRGDTSTPTGRDPRSTSHPRMPCRSPAR